MAGEAERSRVLLVGHEPDFSTLISTIIGGGRIRIRKAALACVDWVPPEPGAPAGEQGDGEGKAHDGDCATGTGSRAGVARLLLSPWGGS